jgi:hypothetical protein
LITRLSSLETFLLVAAVAIVVAIVCGAIR